MNYLEQGKKLTWASLREKTRKQLERFGNNFKAIVDEYNLKNPVGQERQGQRDTLYGAQRVRAGLDKKDTRGRVVAPRPPPPPRRRRIGVIRINGENLTARQVFDRYPQLRQHYNLGSKRLLKDSTLHAKLRKDAKNERIPHDILNEDPPEFRRVENHFGGIVARFKLDDPRIKFHNIPSLRDYLKPQILELIRSHPNTKIGTSVHVWMLNRTAAALQKMKKGLHTGVKFENYQGTNPESVFDAMWDAIFEQLQRLEDVEGSGWILVSVDNVTMTFAEISPVIGSSYRPLPKELEERRENGIDNIDNSKGGCQKCFMWAETRNRFRPKRKPDKRKNFVTKKLIEQSKKLNWDGIYFPTSLADIDIFDNLNKTSTMVLGWDDEKMCVVYLRLPKVKYRRTSVLFYYDKHYSSVRDLSKLLRPYFNDNARHFCHYCVVGYRSEAACARHMERCAMDKITVEKMPKEGSVVKFKHSRETEFKPFTIWADFESRMEKVNVKKGEKTELIQNHRPSGYCMHLVSRVDPSDDRTLNYTAKTNDENVSEHFLKTITNLAKEIGNKYSTDNPLNLTGEEQREFENVTACWVCGNRFLEGDTKVRDHCHYTGKYRGPAHNACNACKLKKDKIITVGFHNGTNYDFHLFVKDLGAIDGRIQVIARNSEKYISVTKFVCVGEHEILDEKTKKPVVKKDFWQLRFIDTCGILKGRLEDLVKNLPEDEFKILRKRFPEDDEFNLVLRKGVFPYEWFDDIGKLDVTKIPPIESFYSSLTGKGIDAEDYSHAKKVRETFGLKTMREYHDFYCEIDTLQLADVFEYQRNRLMETHGLDVAHSYTLPGFSWKAALKYTEQVIETRSIIGSIILLTKI